MRHILHFYEVCFAVESENGIGRKGHAVYVFSDVWKRPMKRETLNKMNECMDV